MWTHVSTHIHEHIQVYKHTHTPHMVTEYNQSQPKQPSKTLPQNKIKGAGEEEHKILNSIPSTGGKRKSSSQMPSDKTQYL